MEEGEGENRVPRLDEGASQLEIAQKLRKRYFQAFQKKARKFKKYRRQGDVRADVPGVLGGCATNSIPAWPLLRDVCVVVSRSHVEVARVASRYGPQRAAKHVQTRSRSTCGASRVAISRVGVDLGAENPLRN